MGKYVINLLVLLCVIHAGCFSQMIIIPPQDNHIVYEGRIGFKNGVAELSWPGTSIIVQFVGTGISAQFKDADTSNYYNIIIDRDSMYKLQFDTTKKIYPLATGLAYGKHTVEVFKRTEWDKGKTWFYGIVEDGKTKLLPPAPKHKRKIEFYGNSISCGYAIEDPAGNNHAGYFENNYNAYPAITARHYNAQYQCIAKSGIGIMVSWFPLIMPEMYDRVDATDSTSKWDFSKYTPDIVVINLFQNDSWIVKQHNNAQFKARFGTTPPKEDYIINAYKNFVQTIRGKYPNAQIICMLGNMDITQQGSPWPGYVTEAVKRLNDKKIFTYVAPYKNTPGHPVTAEQKTLADGLINFIDKHVQW